MVVDDSTIVRGLITRALTEDPGIEVVCVAVNGAMAIPLAREHQPDIILLDIEMPEMDGLTALPHLLQVAPKAKIVMVSTLTLRNATISFKALSLGASDCVAKPTARTPEELELFYRDLRGKIHALCGTRSRIAAAPASASASVTVTVTHAPIAPVKALAIASSTGGPQALQQLFAGLAGQLGHVPIFITQHMPATFTTILAEHLAKCGERHCAEGKDGEEILPGHCYLAPGDYHMVAVRSGTRNLLRLNQEPPVNFCRPAADPMFKSLSAIYGKHLMSVVLTGMGHDGLDGAKTIVAGGGNVVAQDEASSVVWGMPKAVATANLCREILPLGDIAPWLVRHIQR
jgi:two-component system chemotaxis response regulator CheB